jgi:hypothetical protein
MPATNPTFPLYPHSSALSSRRVDDHRLFFVCPDPDTLEVDGVLHRKEA